MRPSRKRIAARIITTVITVAIAAVIFYLSAQPADDSSGLSSFLCEKILTLFDFYKNADAAKKLELLVYYDGVLRCLAHFGVFFLLSLSSAFMWKAWDIGWPSSAALVTAALYAVTDELHQLFVPGRAFQFTDILIDLAGAFLAVLIFFLIFFFRRGRDRRKRNALAKELSEE